MAEQAREVPSDGTPSQSSRISRKRPRDDLSLLCELPPAEAEIVSLALDQWGRLRQRVKSLEPTLRRESALVQEILDTGLRDENRRTLRKLTQSSGGGDVEETIQQVGKAIGANRERLERILERNHGELVRLSTTTVPDTKEDVLREVDEVLARLKQALSAVKAKLLRAKEHWDMTEVRRTGRSFNDLKGLVRRLDEERRLITRNSALAALLVTVCRRVLPVRQVDPSTLRDIEPSLEGYRRIMDFYFFTDAALYFFGDYPSGPNWFVRLKRNIAILRVSDRAGRVVYNSFAVSGEHRAPGAPLAPDAGPLLSVEAKDEHGRMFNRQHDAEFKLLSGFCQVAAGFADGPSEGKVSAWEGTGTLWSRKPLCTSCWGAVSQVKAMFPKLVLTVSVGSKNSKPWPDNMRYPPDADGPAE
ncbi:HCc2, partial [Symbiodinium sp. CCMP2456]